MKFCKENKGLSKFRIFINEFLSAIVVAIIIFIALYLFVWPNRINSNNYLVFLGMTMLYSIPINISITYLFKFLNIKISWEKHPLKMVIYGSIFSIVISIIWIFIVQLIEINIFRHMSFEIYFSSINYSYFKMPLYITGFILILVYTFYFYKELQKSKLSEAKLQAENAKANYNAIKDQIDPHFLFNNLNVLYSLIDENTKNAKKFVKNLSTIYRYILEHKQTDLTPLNTEMDFATKYLELLKFRFENSLNFNINISNNNKEIVPLASQILLENAIKHNTITDIDPLKIEIYTKDDYFVVENNYNPLNGDYKSTKHGLKSINERCKYLMDKEIIVDKKDNKFIVKVPLK